MLWSGLNNLNNLPSATTAWSSSSTQRGQRLHGIVVLLVLGCLLLLKHLLIQGTQRLAQGQQRLGPGEGLLLLLLLRIRWPILPVDIVAPELVVHQPIWPVGRRCRCCC
jgi:hypothetical protein